MARNLYRKATLERLSSPEQLDQLTAVTGPGTWFVLLGGAIIVLATLIWSIVGRLPIKQDASGIYLTDSSSTYVASTASGVVTQVFIAQGDTVTEGQPMFEVSASDYQTELDSLYDRLQKVQAVTLDSVGDEASQDNQQMINLKTQLKSASLSSEQQAAMLSQYQSQLSSVTAKVDAARAEMDAARANYYAALGTVSSADVELTYSQAQSKLSSASGIYESSKSSNETQKAAYQNGLAQCVTYAQNMLEQCNNAISEYALANESSYRENYAIENPRYEGTFNEETQEYEGAESEESFNQRADDAWEAALAAGTAQYRDVINRYNFWLEILAALQDGIGSTDTCNPSGLSGPLYSESDVSQYNSLQSLYSSYYAVNASMLAAKGELDTAQEAYDTAAAAYQDYVNKRNTASANQTTLGNIYNEKSSVYNNLYSQQQSLQAQITSLKGQQTAAGMSDAAQAHSLREQFNTARQTAIDTLQTQIDKYTDAVERYTVTAPFSGTVTEIKARVGAAVQQGGDSVTLRKDNGGSNRVVCYIPLSSGKSVEVGMEVTVTPTTISEQEYGHMFGTVVGVDDYVASVSSLRETLGDDNLANAFLQSGPVVGVVVELETDESAANGYRWSNRKGQNVLLAEGTMMTAKVVLEKKAPITLLLPYIKEKLTMAAKPAREGAAR